MATKKRSTRRKKGAGDAPELREGGLGSVEDRPSAAVKPKSQAALTRAILRARAVELKIAGASEEQIAKQLGTSQKKVSALLDEATERMQEKFARDVEKARRIEISRLDMLQLALWPHAVGIKSEDRKPDYAAVDRVLKIISERSKLRGLHVNHVEVDAGSPLEGMAAVVYYLPENGREADDADGDA